MPIHGKTAVVKLKAWLNKEGLNHGFVLAGHINRDFSLVFTPVSSCKTNGECSDKVCYQTLGFRIKLGIILFKFYSNVCYQMFGDLVFQCISASSIV